MRITPWSVYTLSAVLVPDLFEQQPKHRIPKHNALPIEITSPGEWNNGNVEVIQPEAALTMPPKVHVDEVLINGRRYRIPEKVIVMDFWNKTGKGPRLDHEYVLFSDIWPSF